MTKRNRNEVFLVVVVIVALPRNEVFLLVVVIVALPLLRSLSQYCVRRSDRSDLLIPTAILDYVVRVYACQKRDSLISCDKINFGTPTVSGVVVARISL